MGTHRLGRAAALIALLVVGQRAGASITLLDTAGFEPGLYTTTNNLGQPTSYDGQLEGQPITSPVEESWHQSSATPDASHATVQTAYVQSGTQAVRLDYGGVDARWGVPIDLAGSESVTISFGFSYFGTGIVPVDGTGPFGPFYGLEAYGNSAGGATRLGAIYVDATTNQLFYLEPGLTDVTEALAFLSPGTPTSPVWHSISMVLDYVSQEYSVFVDSVLTIDGIGFVDGPSATFGSADLFAGTSAGTAFDPPSTAPDAGFVDNFVITAEVPELSTGALWLGLSLIGGGGCWWKRRRASLV